MKINAKKLRTMLEDPALQEQAITFIYEWVFGKPYSPRNKKQCIDRFYAIQKLGYKFTIYPGMHYVPLHEKPPTEDYFKTHLSQGRKWKQGNPFKYFSNCITEKELQDLRKLGASYSIVTPDVDFERENKHFVRYGIAFQYCKALDQVHLKSKSLRRFTAPIASKVFQLEQEIKFLKTVLTNPNKYC